MRREKAGSLGASSVLIVPPGNNNHRVIIDDREPRELMLPALAGCGIVDVEMRRLSLGDYLIDDVLLVERKTLRDLVASIKEGRLFRQALRLAKQEIPAVLILEGTAHDLCGSGMSWEAIQGALIAVSLFIGLPVLRSRDAVDTVRTFVYATRQRRKLVRGHLVRQGRRPKGKVALRSHILQGLPGVGPRRAQQMLRRFGSVASVMSASEQALADVEGVGAVTARKIRWAVEEPLMPYCWPASNCGCQQDPAASTGSIQRCDYAQRHGCASEIPPFRSVRQSVRVRPRLLVDKILGGK